MNQPRYNVINLTRQRWAQSADTYKEALAIALQLETDTKQPHGVQKG